MAYDEHRRAGEQLVARFAIITLSDTRTESTDFTGTRIKQLLAAANHQIPFYKIIPDDPATFEPLLHQLLANNDINTILTNGGTGISPRDQTIPVVERAITLPLPGFGELFRMLSYNQIASAAMLSRATAGIAQNHLLFALPGSPKAAELALSKLILPELGHLLSELHK